MRTKLGEVASERRETLRVSRRGRPVVGLEHLIPGEVLLTAWDVDSDNTFTKVFRKGQILFGRRRAYLKKATVAPFDGICSGDITVIEARPEALLPELLPFIIQNDTFFNYAVEKSAGSLSPRVKWEHLSNFEFELPPIEKQRKLAELFWAANATREAYKKLLTATDELVKSQFIEMFGDPMTNPMGWDKVPMGQHLSLLTDFSANGSYKYLDSNVVMYDHPSYALMVRTTDLEKQDFTKEVKYINQAAYEILKKSKLFGGEIIMNKIGSAGKVYLMPYLNYPASLGRNAFMFRYTKSINTIFIYYLLTSKYGEDKIQQHVRGAVTKTITKDAARSIPIIVPPIELQNRFADFVRAADKSKFELQRTINELEATYKALLREELG